MKPIQMQLTFTLNDESLSAFVELLERVIRQSTAESALGVIDTVKRIKDQHEQSGIRKKTPLESSQHALFGGQKPPVDTGLLIDTRETAKLLNVSDRTIWTMNSSGKMPKAIRVGRAVRWSLDELKDWIAEGCPPRVTWEQRRATRQ